ncbi:hypothetical protein H6G97_20275 [Nostoc flagelliforme FACHB-838]|uniref:Uncharacterized protein n=1 Tax=Nostoc flagelliforme FACHB-838 TaxID=2692904 RepID=A0ABR8DQR6_9NOSO|nr:hypothetical protein [Nostoc flagelliforme]MBD2531804.1 hypothetical protein [Nostoc flagelliforme FACHB-838]
MSEALKVLATEALLFVELMLVSKQALFQKLMKLSAKLWLLSAFGDQSRVAEGRKKKKKTL